ncbi:MAG TPA: LysM peptidoglycan-binding domain-containing protein [Bacillota bacterium]|nr:LysM peptidoglycan-binding domain-containing protein [Bacillota bacterium]
MPLAVVKPIWFHEGLEGLVKVEWGRVVSNGRPDLIAAAGRRFFIFTPTEFQYVAGLGADVGTEVLSLAVGLPADAKDNIVLGTEDRILAYAVAGGEPVRILETGPEPGARFVGLSLADLDGDGRQEVIAVSEGKQAFYVYSLIGEPGAFRLSLTAIRILPGPGQRVTAFKTGERLEPAVATAYSSDAGSGLAVFIFTERGFAEGPSQELPARVMSLASGDLTPGPGEELAWGGSDGSLRAVEIDDVINTSVVSDNLGTAVPALTVGRLSGDAFAVLIAGTAEGFIFGFAVPVSGGSPDWAVRVARPVNDIDVSEEGLLGLGTADGGVQVWLLSSGGRAFHVVRKGETLSSIARMYAVAAAEIAVANNIKDISLIFPGRVLIIP